MTADDLSTNHAAAPHVNLGLPRVKGTSNMACPAGGPEVAFVAAGSEPLVGEAVPEPVWPHPFDVGLLAAA